MSNTPSHLRYTNDHEWIDPVTHRVGVTTFAGTQLGDVVMVEVFRKVGDKIEQGDELGTIESVKAVSELFSPVSGTIKAINTELADAPETLNEDPYGAGWILELEPSDAAEIAELKDAAAYDKFTTEA